MPKMRLSTTAELFIQNRIAISAWLLANKITVLAHFWPNQQKVWLLFDNTRDAAAFVKNFEGL